MEDGFELGDIILERLSRAYRVDPGEFAALKAAREGNPFKVIVATIISQDTTEKNTFRALQRLEETIGVDQFKLSNASVEEVASAISPAGLQRQKAAAIVSVARLLVEKYGGRMEELLKRGEEFARRELKSLRGVGEKTVDVLLANAGFPVVPVDTHVKRVAQRLGITGSRSYLGVRSDLHRVFRPERRLEAHLLLIKLGREVCKARKPQCGRCPLRDICKYNLEKEKQEI
ncbi:endonuclease III [Infirmifilum lucidum]|uniref:Endonuclease III n=1 Tax=Infirmifilum lucidum TaxID=2776706 RepID=A0A7L9FFB5_9CREN|nr:endonuclease III [Infirmifilum lucidum]QOJ78470.1 endonuclease III [Infirmifilum lucidum]